MKTFKPSSEYIKIWRIRATGLLILVAFLSGFLYVFMPVLALTLGVVSIVSYPIYMFIYLPKLYKNYCYTIEDECITVVKGFIFYKHIKLDFKKIQFAQEIQSPIQRRKKLYSLNLYTAGSKLFIDCISRADIQLIKKSIEKFN